MTKRLFLSVPFRIGVELPRNPIMEQKIPGFRWMESDNLHLTLVFLGDTDESLIPKLTEGARLVAESTSRFYVAYDSMIPAPPNSVPSMFWLKFLPNSEWTHLVDNLQQVAIRAIHGFHSFPAERQLPHITIARFKPFAQLKGCRFASPKMLGKGYCIKTFELMESELRSEGPKYTPLATFDLRNA